MQGTGDSARDACYIVAGKQGVYHNYSLEVTVGSLGTLGLIFTAAATKRREIEDRISLGFWSVTISRPFTSS